MSAYSFIIINSYCGIIVLLIPYYNSVFEQFYKSYGEKNNILDIFIEKPLNYFMN